MFIQGEGNGKSLLWECCLVHPQGSPGVLHTRRTSIISMDIYGGLGLDNKFKKAKVCGYRRKYLRIDIQMSHKT